MNEQELIEVQEDETTTTLTKERVDQLVEIGQNLVDAACSKPTLAEKLKSRKFWLSAATAIVGICGLIGFSDNTTAIIVFAILEIVSVVGYCIVEGYIDAARAKEMLAAIGTIGSMIGNKEVAEAEAQKAVDEFKDAPEDEIKKE